MIKDYCTIENEYEAQYIVSRSRFIACVKRVSTIEEGLDFVKDVKNKYKEASHYPYAIVAEPNCNGQKFSDDGEPQGTSGLPIFECIKARGLNATVIVVCRYFGGIKLGTGGLANAYKTASLNALDGAGVVKAVLSDIVELKLPYDLTENFLRAVNPYCEVIEKQYFSSVSLKLATTNLEKVKQEIKKYTSGGEIPLKINTQFYFYKGKE